MAHVGRLYPVAFRRDLNLGTTRNTDYLGRCWYCEFHLTAGSLGTALLGGRYTDINEATPTGQEYSRWIGGPYVDGGRTFSIQMRLGAGAGTYFKLSVDIIDSIRGVLATFTRSWDQIGIYNNLGAEGSGSANPYPAILDTSNPACYVLPKVVRWAEYNGLHP